MLFFTFTAIPILPNVWFIWTYFTWPGSRISQLSSILLYCQHTLSLSKKKKKILLQTLQLISNLDIRSFTSKLLLLISPTVSLCLSINIYPHFYIYIYLSVVNLSSSNFLWLSLSALLFPLYPSVCQARSTSISTHILYPAFRVNSTPRSVCNSNSLMC